MINRLDYVAINGPAIASMAKAKTHMPSIDPKLKAILELRVSQINGCAYCVDLHTTEARKAGETQQRLDCLTSGKRLRSLTPPRKPHLHGPKPSP